MGPDRHAVTKPIVGAIDGFVNGAAIWLFLQADIRLATPQAFLGLAEGRVNIPVEFSALLTRYMPRTLINEMPFTGRNISAQRFYDLGVISKNLICTNHFIREGRIYNEQ